MKQNQIEDNIGTEVFGGGVFRPKLTFYHANSKGTGSAIEFELQPATIYDEGTLWAKFANQLTIGDMTGPNPIYPRFDWDNGFWLKLGFNDLTKMLQVFRGECESIDNDKGLYHRGPGYCTVIRLKHQLDPYAGYAFEAYRNISGRPEEDKSARILFRPHEALGLSEAIAGSFSVLCFGIFAELQKQSASASAAPVATTERRSENVRAA